MITLVIIGVIAAFTIPTLINKYQKEQTVEKLKKSYSTLQQAISRSIADYGIIDLTEIPVQNGNAIYNKFFTKYLKPYLSISTDCGVNTTDECAFVYTNISGNGTYTHSTVSPRFYISDGTFVSLQKYGDYISFYIDINGQKKPNRLGRDVFRFDLWPEELFLKPCSDGHTREQMLGAGSYTCNKYSSGHYCAAVIVLDGWQIKDDYPW